MAVRIGEAGNTSHTFALSVLARRGFIVLRGPGASEDVWAIHPDGRTLIGSWTRATTRSEGARAAASRA
jgi:hypothetical protein